MRQFRHYVVIGNNMYVLKPNKDLLTYMIWLVSYNNHSLPINLIISEKIS